MPSGGEDDSSRHPSLKQLGVRWRGHGAVGSLVAEELIQGRNGCGSGNIHVMQVNLFVMTWISQRRWAGNCGNHSLNV